MNRVLVIAPALLLSLVLGGCTGGAAVTPSSAPAAASAAASGGSPASGTAEAALAQAEEGQDLGNGRPVVSYDGLMVRRRVVIAVRSSLTADLPGIRKVLDAAAAARGTVLAGISPSVLEPALLQQLMPELVVALPSTGTRDDGRALAKKAEDEGAEKLGAEHFHVLQTLVHDLRFSIRTTSPTALSAAVDLEGILSDALGNYDTTVGDGVLSIDYTGPLLGDEIVESVRAGIARQARTAPSAVEVKPRAETGTGVDMATEPPWDPVVPEAMPDHAHG
ncbi:hypothetical protein [Arthrobacter pascens]|uniref:hypothetical protein n=1 Tax=Arthrobacter pascens TaxID=1677 RepID=UPI00196A87CC|nr:hypothetical protein [Arthrobacter pascens]MBN3498305.1 hypothetical protein [Arthrobacter pascens]